MTATVHRLKDAVDLQSKKMAATAAVSLARLIAHVLRGNEQAVPFVFGLRRKGFVGDDVQVTVVVTRVGR